MKGKNKKEEESGQTVCPWEGAMKEERFPRPGDLLHLLGGLLGQSGSWRGLYLTREECAGAGLLVGRVERD